MDAFRVKFLETFVRKLHDKLNSHKKQLLFQPVNPSYDEEAKLIFFFWFNDPAGNSLYSFKGTAIAKIQYYMQDMDGRSH